MTLSNASRPVRPLPAWFDDAKFGIFIHWTAAAIPAFAPPQRPAFFSEFGSEDFDWAHFFQNNPAAESYWNCMSIPGSSTAAYHTEHYGDLPFEAFVEEFRTGLKSWDPEPWADLFAQSGARYVVFVAKCEDGFLLWPSAHPNPYRENWQAERDVIGELAAAVRARGMRFGVMYTGGMDWTFGGIPITDMDSMMAAEPDTEEYAAYADAHWRELVERYQPSVLWNDYSYTSKADPNSLYSWYVEKVPDGVMNDRFAEISSMGGDDVVVFSHQVGDFATTEYACQGDLPGFAKGPRARSGRTPDRSVRRGGTTAKIATRTTRARPSWCRRSLKSLPTAETTYSTSGPPVPVTSRGSRRNVWWPSAGGCAPTVALSMTPARGMSRRPPRTTSSRSVLPSTMTPCMQSSWPDRRCRNRSS